MNLQSIARALNGTVRGSQVMAPGPNHTLKDRSLSVWIDRNASDGFRVHSFAGDDWKVCRDYVGERLGLSRWEPRSSVSGAEQRDQPRVLSEVRAASPDDQGRIALAQRVWGEGVSPSGTLVERYLHHRGLFLPDDVLAADQIRFHPACAFRLDDGTLAHLPSMLGLMRDIVTNEPRALHRTALRSDGTGKADLAGLSDPKKMLWPAKDAVVKLSGDAKVTDGLGIAEGLENALTATCAGWQPVWACGSAGAIERFLVLKGIDALTIFADADEAGLRAARSCQTRWNEAGRECRILLPPGDGMDWNDVRRVA